MKPRRRVPFYAQILTAMAVGLIAGSILGPRARPLGDLGKVILDLIKALAGPLLLFAILDAFLRTKLRLRSGLLMVAISLTNAAIAVVIGLGLSNLLRPGDQLVLRSLAVPKGGALPIEPHEIDFWKEILGYVPTSVIKPLLDNSIISLIVLAVLGGFALRQVKNEQEARGETGFRVVEDLVTTLYRTIEVMLGSIIMLVPVAVFGVVAKTIGTEGFRPLIGLGAYVGVAVLGLAIQVLVVYQAWIVFVARKRLRWFWEGARDALVYALGSSSSLATLPITLRCLDKMKVTPQSARLAACVGTNLNNDGILLYEAMAVLFVAQVHGIHLTLGQQVVAASACVIAGIGIAAVPDAGLISLALVLATAHLPTDVLPLLLTVDWLLSRCRALTNVSSDILVAVLLDRFGNDADETLEPAIPTAEESIGAIV